MYININAQYLRGPEEDISSPEPGVIDCYEQSWGCWERNQGPLQE